MRREQWVVQSLATGPVNVMAYGHYGPPVVFFTAERGDAWDFENTGLLDAVRPLLDGGRCRIFAVDSYDTASWRNHGLSLEDRARAHQRFEDFVLADLVPAVRGAFGTAPADPLPMLLTGPSLGGFHAANLCLRRADLFPVALCLSGVFDLSHVGWGERGDTFYFHNPMDYVANMDGDHLDWVRRTANLVLCVGTGMWEDASASGALPSTLRFAELLARKGIPHELDVWGTDTPHDWPSWARMLVKHLPRLL
jgi:esterase/lipase superfamily enzyme